MSARTVSTTFRSWVCAGILSLLLLLFLATKNQNPPPQDWWAQVSERIAAAEYEASPVGGVLQAPNRAQNLRTFFRPEGIEIHPREPGGPSWTYRWGTTAWGRPGDLRACEAIAPRAQGTRIEYEYAGMTEWYENRPDGLEQGFTIGGAPAGSGPLTITARIGGSDAAPRLDARGSAIELVDRAGALLFHYGSIVVRDAHGMDLPWKLSLSGDLLALAVDDHDARYPIVIDPLFSTPSWRTEGNQVGAEFGFSVSAAGDVNGDGYSDVLVGAPNYDNGQVEEGRAYLFKGSPTGPAIAPDWIGEPNQPGAQYGFCVAAAGDVNGDKFADVVVGARFLDAPSADEGVAIVYLGSGAGLAAAPSWSAQGDQAGAQLGYSVAGAGDVNGDGYDDLIVGAPFLDMGVADGGAVFVFHGSAAGLSPTPSLSIPGAQAGAQLGYAVASAGDVNADGYADVLFSAPSYDNGNTDEGRASVHLGTPGGVSSSPIWHTEGQQDFSFLGEALGLAGDVNGDGYADIIVGAYLYDDGEADEGRAWVFLGTPAGVDYTPAWMQESDQAVALFGASVGTAGDVNGDGYADVIVGASHFDGAFGNAGRGFVYLGSVAGVASTPVWTKDGENADAQFGFAVSSAGDIDGDGFGDVIVGSHFYQSGQPQEGSAYIFRGSSAGLDAASTLFPGYGTQDGEQLGFSIAAAGDVNGDGRSDVILGAPYYDGGEADEGRAYVFLGVTLGLAYYWVWAAEGDQAGAHFGACVSGAGDVNGDGLSDVLVGATGYNGGQLDEGKVFLYRGSAGGPSTTPDWTLEGDEDFAYLGSALGAAGDVDDDGYGDFLIGAPWSDQGETDEGRALLYRGTTGDPSLGWTGEGNQAGALYGQSVAGAGDVNGDGYSDVVIGASSYDNGQVDEGRAFAYLGGPAGLATSATWTAEVDQAGANFGVSVATAGDVNGDHYSDVIVGANGWDRPETDEGGAFVYLGSPGGLSPTIIWGGQSNQAGAAYGISVSSAGDVNGDGRSDIVVGASHYDGPDVNEGRTYSYLGSASGVEMVAHWTAESDVAEARFGRSVAGAGDVNGDGFADVVIGAHLYSDALTLQGRVYLYLGNGHGKDRSPYQRRADDGQPIHLLGRSESETSFRLRVDGRTPAGRGKVRIEYEIEPFGTAFDGLGLRAGSLLDTGSPDPTGSKVAIDQLVDGLTASTHYTWRLRTASPSPFFPRSPWLTLPGNCGTETDLRTAGPAAAVDGPPVAEARMKVEPSRPNPTSAASAIAYRLTERSSVRVGIYDVAGRRVRAFEERDVEAGAHALAWDGRDERGLPVAAGVYFVRIAAGGDRAVTRRVDIVR